MHRLIFSTSLLVSVTVLFSATLLNLVQCAGAVQRSSYQAEENTKSEKVSRKKSDRGYTGDGYIDYDKDGYIEWNNVNAFNGAGDIILFIRYAAQDPAGRACNLIVNGEQKAVLPFVSTGSYRNWANEAVVVWLRDGDNTVRIKARNRGPHIDKMEVSLMTASPTASPTLSPTKSSQPTMTAAPVTPTGSPTEAPTATPTALTALRSFQLKLYFEDGMVWQEVYERRSWCAECVNCEDGGITEIKRCDTKEKKQKWFFRNKRIVSAEKPDLCMEINKIENSRVRMAKCDNNRDQQVWNGLKRKQKFQLRPKLYPSRCLTQEHHPKDNEHLLLIDCFEAERNDGSLTYPLDGTSYWEIGTWNGHKDVGVLFRHGPH